MPPKTPKRPITDVRGLRDFDYLSSMGPSDLHHMMNKNHDGIPIIREGKDSVCVGYSSLKHGFNFTTDALIFRFADPEMVRSFSVDFSSLGRRATGCRRRAG